MLIVPLAYLAGVAIARINAVGPTVDAPRLDTSFGILALIVGRGVHGLLALPALLLGIGLGHAWRQTTTSSGTLLRTVLRRPLLITLALLVGGITVLNAIPARTPASADLPVLLYLSGGPGQSDLPFPRAIFADLTEQFIVVRWDQRGTGKSYATLEPTATLTLVQAVAGTIALTNYLRERFAEEKIYLRGSRWARVRRGLVAARM
jgi:pimeloyl-ACP methyl ester carboxylesterase